MTSELEQVLDRLTFTTEALRNVSQDPLGPGFGALLDERSSQLHLLQTLSEERGLKSGHLDRLREITTLGDELRTPLMVRRAHLKERLDEVRAAKQAQRTLNPPNPSRGGRINVRA